MKEVPYGKWRDYDPEDTVRFYSLRLHEVGMIKSTPQKIIAQGTDWRFLRGAPARIAEPAALAGTGAALLGLKSDAVAAEPAPETTRIRLTSIPGVCVAPRDGSEELLRVEGFTDVQDVKLQLGGLYKAFASGDVDISMAYAPPFIIQIEAGEPILLLGGVHAGCYELFGSQRVRAIRDLKGKTVAIPAQGSPHHVFLASMAAYVG